MDCGSSRIEIEWVPTGDLAPNPWNPNRMGPVKLAKLAREIEQRGFSAPILARRKGRGLEVVDGEHRLMAAHMAGLDRVPVVVAELDDAQAMLKTLQMNELHGENDPELLAALLEKLSHEMSAAEMASLLPWSDREIECMIESVIQSAGEAEGALQAAAAESVPQPEFELFAAVVSPDEKRVIEQRIEQVKMETGTEEDGEALAAICAGLSLGGVTPPARRVAHASCVGERSERAGDAGVEDFDEVINRDR